MPAWSNWSGRLQARPARVHAVRNELDAQALVRTATQSGERIRVAGAAHSHSPLVVHDGIVVDSSPLSGVIETDSATQTAWVWAGTRMHALGLPLHRAGLGLHNQGDIDQQAIAGAAATGTHGTGRHLTNLSAAVTGVQLVLAGGDLVNCSTDTSPDLFQAARLNLGAMGIVTRLQLKMRPAYRLRETSWQSSLEEVLDQAPARADAHRHFEFFWYPQTDLAQAKCIDETDDQPEYPVAAEGTRCGWSYEVLPNLRPHKHTEMEYSVPLEAGPACMRAIATLLRARFPDVSWPVEYRTLAADDVWLSSAYERDTVTVSVHQAIDQDDEPYFRACEEIFLAFSGRPHWGKVHYLSGATLAKRHPRWTDWWAARDRADPTGTFMNDYLTSLRT